MDKNDSTVETLCWASLICWLNGNLLFWKNSFFKDILGDFLQKIVDPLSGLFFIAGFILLIISLVNYPHSKFAKVLLIIYVLEIIIFIITFFLAFMACMLIIESCTNGISSFYTLGWLSCIGL